ncbi:MAG: ThiF family adenylyltransferase [Anaerolineaceae bacterium]|nr:ThiF family adenylyltransferase [Anaerolineaceae bacterium]
MDKIKNKNPEYKSLFERNYGVFSPEEQEKLRKGNVLIIGSGGIGGIVAISLARTGVENMTIYEYDTFQVSNLNRQICCNFDTLGQNKGVVTKESILKINPDAKINIIPRELRPDEISSVIKQEAWDVIMPAADSWPISVSMLDASVDAGIPAIMSYPAGALGRVSSFMPGGPYASECLTMPYRASYDELKVFMESKENRSILYYYRSLGGWTQEWFEGFCDGKLPHPQIAPIVWITGSLAAMEIIKIITGRWKPVAAPNYWHITPDGGHIAKFGLGRRLLSRMMRQEWGKALIPAVAKHPGLVRIFTRLIS